MQAAADNVAKARLAIAKTDQCSQINDVREATLLQILQLKPIKNEPMLDTINRIRKVIDCKKRRDKRHKMTLGARTFLRPEEITELACHTKESKLAKESRLTPFVFLTASILQLLSRVLQATFTVRLRTVQVMTIFATLWTPMTGCADILSITTAPWS